MSLTTSMRELSNGNDHGNTARLRTVACSTHRTRTLLAVCVLLVLAVAVVFGQTVRHQFVNYDDDQYIYLAPAQVTKGLTLNGIAWAFTHSHAQNRHPLTTLSHMVDCQLYGLQPGGHHLTSVLLHTATSILLFLVLYWMTGGLAPSALVAAVFAVHPLRVESVAWVAERKDVLSGLFFMLTLAAYLRYVRRPFALHRYLAVVVTFALGLMSKSMLVTLPFVLLLLDYWPLGRFKLQPALETGTDEVRPSVRLRGMIRLVLEKIPLVALSGVAAAATFLTQRKWLQPLDELSLGMRVANAVVSYGMYLKKFFCPTGLIPFYPHPLDSLPWATAIGCALLLAAISLAAFLGRKKHPYLLVGWLWYLGSLVPVIGLVQAGEQAMADRYTYLTQIGIAIAIAWGLASLVQARPARGWIAGVAAAAILVTLVVAARHQTSRWRDSQTLWTHALQVNPQNNIARFNLGNVYFHENLFDEAIEQYRMSIAIDPDYKMAYLNMGVVLDRLNRKDEAIVQLQKVLELDPDTARAHYDLGNIMVQKGQFEAAVAHYRKALEIDPQFDLPLNNLANALLLLGQADEAIRHLRRAIKTQPNNVDACFNLGNALAERGQLDEALDLWRKVVQQQPTRAQAYLHMGLVLLVQEKRAAAIVAFRQSLEINPNLTQARKQLAALGEPDGRPPMPHVRFQTGN